VSTKATEAAGLRSLLHRLTTFKVTNWVSGSSASEGGTSRDDRVETDLDKADVASSLRPDGRHAVVLDIDHPAWLVRSTTPGHYHLYIDVPEGIPNNQYMDLLNTLAACGVIEVGYANASRQRGHSDVRLPWVKKPAQIGFDQIGLDPTTEWADKIDAAARAKWNETLPSLAASDPTFEWLKRDL
jgi:hypothetical protein